MKRSRNANRLALFIAALLAAYVFCHVHFYVGHHLFGNFDWSIWPSERFGIPDTLKERGMTFLQPLPEAGWDGQFYYYMVLDPLLIDPENAGVIQHLGSNPAYRYQRVGLPLLVATGAFLTGHSAPPVWLYFVVNLLLFAAATWIVFRFALEEKVSLFIAMLWPLGMSVHIGLTNGLPDVTSESFVVFSLYALCRGRLGLYALCASMAVLSKETAVLLYFGLFVLAVLGARPDGKQLPNWSDMSLPTFKIKPLVALVFFALPGAAFVLWQAYLHLRLGSSGVASTSSSLSAPFFTAHVSRVLTLLEQQRWEEGIRILSATSCILFGLAYGLFRARRKPHMLILFSVALIYTFYGPLVLGFSRDILKNIGLLFILFLFFDPPEFSKRYLRSAAFLVAIAIVIVMQTSFFDVRTRYFYPGELRDFPVNDEARAPLENFSAELAITGVEPNSFVNMPFFSVFGRPYNVYNATVRNTGTETWPTEIGPGRRLKGTVSLTYQIMTKEDQQTIRHRSSLGDNVDPGGTRSVRVLVPGDDNINDFREVRLGVIQDGVAFFPDISRESSATVYEGCNNGTLGQPLLTDVDSKNFCVPRLKQ